MVIISLFSAAATASAKITVLTITALWDIANPTGTPVRVTRNAKIPLGAYTDEIDSDDVLSNGITNRNNDSLAYTFAYLRNNETLFTSENGFTVPANTTSNGNYILRVTASRTGYTNKTVDFTFEIAVQTLDFTSISLNTDSVIYANENMVDRFEVTFNGIDIPASINLTDLLEKEGTLSYWFTIEDGNSQQVTEIKLVGNYTLILHLDSTIFTAHSYNHNLAITKYTIILRDYVDQIALSKQFALDDPDLISPIVIGDTNDEVVRILFTRAAGEAIGLYALTYSEIVDNDDKANYQVDDSSFVEYFEIEQANTNLKVTLDDALTFIYNGSAVSSFSSNYTNGNYVLSFTAGSTTVQTNYSLYYLIGNTRVYIPENEKQTYAQNLIFTVASPSRNIGVYEFSVSMEDPSGWDGIDITNTAKANITITQRTVTVNSITKVFDQTNTFVYNNTDSSVNTVFSMALSNVVAGDVLQISGRMESAYAGQRNITNIAFDNIDAGHQANYTLALANGLQVLVVPSEDAVNVTSTTSELNYGQVLSSSTLANVLNLVPLAYNNGAIDGAYISADSYAITGATYSTGTYLEVGEYDFVFTMVSQNYTFGQTRQAAVGTVYSKTYTIHIAINQINMTINNSVYIITKSYDGNNVVLAQFVSETLNELNGHYSSNELLANDVITIVSATYADREVEDNKVITLVLGDDKANYNITQNVRGNITPIQLVFKKNGATLAFADGVKPFSNTADIVYPYNSDLSTLIDTITDANTFLSRVGYTQLYWTYTISGNEERIDTMTENQRQTLLQNAVDAGATGVIINAYWQVNQYTLRVLSDEFTTTSVTTTTFDYYDTFTDISVNVAIGRTFEEITLSANVAELSITSGQHTRVAAFTLTHITDDLDVTLTTEEITVKITIDYNNPESFGVDTNTTNWTGGLRERIVSYTELSTTNLPILYVTTPHTYDFVEYEIQVNDEFVDSTGSTIWARINGDTFLQDNVNPGFFFKAKWTESELTITVTSTQSTIVLKRTTNGLNQVVSPTGNVYNVKFNDDIYIGISSTNWWRWTGLTISGVNYSTNIYTEVTGDNEPTLQQTGAFTIVRIRDSLSVEITITPVEVTFTTDYTTPNGADVLQTQGARTGVYTIVESSKTTLGHVVEYYTLTEGTYAQDYWVYDNGTTTSQVVHSREITSLITTINGGYPTENITIHFTAHFVGLEWTVIYDKNSEYSYFVNGYAGVTNGGEGTENTKLTHTVTQITYGGSIGEVPVLVNTQGREYEWSSAQGKKFSNNTIFVTTAPNAERIMVLQAEWTAIRYSVIVNWNHAKVNGVMVGEDDYESGEVLNRIFWGTNLTFTFDLAEGYEIDTVNTSYVDHEGPEGGQSYKATTISFSPSQAPNVLFVSSVQRSTVINVAIKAKDYIITVETNSYVTISQTTFNVH